MPVVRGGNAYRINALVLGNFPEVDDPSAVGILVVTVDHFLAIVAAIGVHITNGNRLYSLSHEVAHKPAILLAHSDETHDKAVIGLGFGCPYF